MEFMINYSCHATNKEQAKDIGAKIHSYLQGNPDYINSSILLNIDDTYINIYVYPMECKEPVPEFLQSNVAFMAACVIWSKEEDENAKTTVWLSDDRAFQASGEEIEEPSKTFKEEK